MEFHHISVLLEETIRGLMIKPDGIYVDCTLGGAGHSRRIAEQLSDKGRLIGIDQDPAALAAAKKRLADVSCQVDLVQNNFSNFSAILAQLDIPQVDGVVFDLGVSSHQLDEAERGFSYMQDAPLDMRMPAWSRQLLSAAKSIILAAMLNLAKVPILLPKPMKVTDPF